MTYEASTIIILPNWFLIVLMVAAIINTILSAIKIVLMRMERKLSSTTKDGERG